MNSLRPIRLQSFWSPMAPFVLITDVLIVWLSSQLVAYFIAFITQRSLFWPLPETWFLLSVAIAIVYPLSLQAVGVYRPLKAANPGREVLVRLAVWSVLFIALIVFMFASKTGAHFSRMWVASWFALVAVLNVIEVEAFQRIAASRFRRGIGLRGVLIVGSGGLAERTAQAMRDHPQAGLKAVGYLSEGGDDRMPEWIPCLGSLDDLDAVLARRLAIQEAWVTLPISAQERIRALLNRMRENLIDVRLVPDIFTFDLLNRNVQEILGMPVIGLATTPHVGLDHVVKRLMDIVGALIALLICLPLMLGCALMVGLTSPGGVLFRQPRHGLDGRPFTALKFRTMYTSSEPESRTTYQQATRDDPRVTRVGRFLRRSSLDELPQLLNVLQGEMSLVGPRPHPVTMNVTHWDTIDRYALRHRVKPGITGWAQIHGLRGETRDVSLLCKRIEYDLFYIDNWSIGLDVEILLKTVLVVWFQRTAY